MTLAPLPVGEGGISLPHPALAPLDLGQSGVPRGPTPWDSSAGTGTASSESGGLLDGGEGEERQVCSPLSNAHCILQGNTLAGALTGPEIWPRSLPPYPEGGLLHWQRFHKGERKQEVKCQKRKFLPMIPACPGLLGVGPAQPLPQEPRHEGGGEERDPDGRIRPQICPTPSRCPHPLQQGVGWESQGPANQQLRFHRG